MNGVTSVSDVCSIFTIILISHSLSPSISYSFHFSYGQWISHAVSSHHMPQMLHFPFLSLFNSLSFTLAIVSTRSINILSIHENFSIRLTKQMSVASKRFCIADEMIHASHPYAANDRPDIALQDSLSC